MRLCHVHLAQLHLHKRGLALLGQENQVYLSWLKRPVTKKLRLGWPWHGAGKPQQLLMREYLSKYFNCGLISEGAPISADVDDTISLHHVSCRPEDTCKQSAVSDSALKFAAVSTADASGARRAAKQPQPQPLVVVIVRQVEV